MASVDPTISNLLSRYDELTALGYRDQLSYVKKNLLTTDGSLKPKTIWTRFLLSCCFTRASFKSENKISLKQIETKLANSLTAETSYEDVQKIAKCVLVLKKFQGHKYENGISRHVKLTVASSSQLGIDSSILLLRQIKEAKDAGQTSALPLLKRQITGVLDNMKNSMPIIVDEANRFVGDMGCRQQTVSLALLDRLREAMERVLQQV